MFMFLLLFTHAPDLFFSSSDPHCGGCYLALYCGSFCCFQFIVSSLKHVQEEGEEPKLQRQSYPIRRVDAITWDVNVNLVLVAGLQLLVLLDGVVVVVAMVAMRVMIRHVVSRCVSGLLVKRDGVPRLHNAVVA
jgi:hypothetical protein